MSLPRRLFAIATFIYVAALMTISGDPNLYPLANIAGYGLIGMFGFLLLTDRNFRSRLPVEVWLLCAFLITITASAIVIRQGDAIARLLTIYQTAVLACIIVIAAMHRVGGTSIIWGAGVGALIGLAVLYLSGQIGAPSVQRSGALFENPNDYSIALVVCMLFLLDRVANVEWYRWNTVLLSTAVLIASIVFIICAYQIYVFTGTRKGAIALPFIALSIWITFVLGARKRRSAFLTVVAVGIGVVMAGWIVDFVINSPFLARLQNLVDAISGAGTAEISISDRTLLISKAVSLWMERPLFGWGLEGFQAATGFGAYAHNNYVELLANFGAVGFCLYYAIHLSIAVKVLHLKRAGLIGTTGLIWAFTALLVLLFLDVAMVSYYSEFTWLALAYLIGYVNQRRPAYASDNANART